MSTNDSNDTEPVVQRSVVPPLWFIYVRHYWARGTSLVLEEIAFSMVNCLLRNYFKGREGKRSMNPLFDTDKVVEKELDRISEKGEKIGNVLGRVFRFVEKNLLGVIIIVVFGLLVFLYSMAKGFMRKRR